MKRYITILVFILLLIKIYPQKLDLIVTNNGDSIACSIDSLNVELIYFEMKNNNRWVHTKINMDRVGDYQFDTVKWILYEYKPGSSYIDSYKTKVVTVNEMRKNSFYIEIKGDLYSINYDRLFPTNNYIGIALHGGIIHDSYEEKTRHLGEVIFLAGRNGHYFEQGFGWIYFASFMPVVRLGYRYQSSFGLLVKAGPTLYNGDFYFGLSVGWSF